MQDLPASLILAFMEGGTLQVFADGVAATSEFEGIDAESEVVNFYSLSGAYMEPRFTRPNRQGKSLGLFRWVESGSYDLVPSYGEDHDPLALALHETSLMEPNDFFSDLSQLKQVLRMRGVQVDFNHGEGQNEG